MIIIGFLIALGVGFGTGYYLGYHYCDKLWKEKAQEKEDKQ